MARDLNKVMVIGRLGKTPEGRFTTEGSFVCTFSVASGRQWNDGAGERREETEWFRCVAWGKLGEICNQYLDKGARVYIEGRLQTRKYTDRDGVERFSTEVVVSDMIILDSRRGGDAPAADEATEAPAPAPRSLASPRTTAPDPTRRNAPRPIGDGDEIPF
jgi:single-strand DNA-binding protein